MPEARIFEITLQQARRHGSADAAFWHRGLTPTPWVERTPRHPKHATWKLLGWPAPWRGSSRDGWLEIFTDGSGGEFSANPLLLRAGWAAVALDMTRCQQGGALVLGAVIFEPLVGDDQCAPKAELQAAVMALRVASMDAPVRIVADCAYVAEGLQHLIEHGTPNGSKHTTLWRSTADVIVARRAPNGGVHGAVAPHLGGTLR